MSHGERRQHPATTALCLAGVAAALAGAMGLAFAAGPDGPATAIANASAWLSSGVSASAATRPSTEVLQSLPFL